MRTFSFLSIVLAAACVVGWMVTGEGHVLGMVMAYGAVAWMCWRGKKVGRMVMAMARGGEDPERWFDLEVRRAEAREMLWRSEVRRDRWRWRGWMVMLVGGGVLVVWGMVKLCFVFY